ncbi:hypothetical protein J7E64_20325 [Priestia megaterium]|nr:hypothetical protein [Priestia megaterium]
MEGKAKTPAGQAVQLMYPICSFLDCIDFVMSQPLFLFDKQHLLSKNKL